MNIDDFGLTFDLIRFLLKSMIMVENLIKIDEQLLYLCYYAIVLLYSK